ncbi:pyridoxamine 5'-phosphate oxidase family protein [Streptomyces sp. YU58]|uniref:pyridoxamine 5'-phosphate oxidase family protein n=1 Tax=Streptomyces sp. SX92 TaxID=3158972 RepID=UPI0027BA2D04|nr:pyridoxamine 5'-phosphate oxidase family protein [Streptomyces coralus]WLW54908.1 pyridoxamine 5'-phosphate oxidase family protein [Streptomyces coralus]
MTDPTSPTDLAADPPSPAAPPLLDRLAEEWNAWLCTVRPDGAPHVTPVWFVFRDDTWWIGTDGNSVKVRNIERFPRVSLTLEDGRFPVVAEGDAIPHRSPFPEAIRAAFAAKYDGWDASVPYRPDGGRVLLEVPVRRWLLTGTAQ